ncbi:MAG: hypothetical protein Q7U14_09240, partial [Lacisediminimonas sp.]|nr:hypothetical protein [Lacisediminimonas sp.]
IHDPQSEVSVAIREHGGYALMPEWDTRPSNHYLPRRKIDIVAELGVQQSRPAEPKEVRRPRQETAALTSESTQ